MLLFTPVSSDIAQANMKAMKESQSTNRPILRKASSLAAPQFVDEIRYYSYPCEVQIPEVFTCYHNAFVFFFTLQMDETTENRLDHSRWSSSSAYADFMGSRWDTCCGDG